MSSLITSEGIVHYEMDGRGEPVILLHGWINSWDVWRETMLHVAERHRFRVYALDFWGFGESASQNGGPSPTYGQATAQLSDAGSYWCVISTPGGGPEDTATSLTVDVTVNGPAQATGISVLPADGLVYQGNAASVTVSASGTAV